MSTGSLIRETREAEGLTQAALARRLGITQPSIARLEAAGAEVSVATLQRALNAMGRALELRAMKRPSSVDETLLHGTLALTPAERFASFEKSYARTRELVLEARGGDDGWPEFRPSELLRRLVANEVDFVVVGAVAAVVHGSATITSGLDIVYALDATNRLGQVLIDVDARLRGVTDDVPFVPDGRTLTRTRGLTLATSQGPIRLLGSPSYDALRERSSPTELAGVVVRIASLEDLIAMRRAAGRPKDLVAVEELAAIQRLRRA
jgi:transcriptional regulator with XRE-family HTH domain